MSAFFNKPTPVKATKLVEIQVDESNPRFQTDITELVESIRMIGMVQPLMVNPGLKLIAGKRRYAAAKKLGLTEVPTIMLTLDSPLEELASIDENLVRLGLNSVEYDDAMFRRKMIYEGQYPNTRAGVAGGARTGEKAFAEDAAEKLDLSRRSVELAVARSKFASAKVKEARLHGLSPSKVNEIVTLEPKLQDEILSYVTSKPVSEVREIVKRVKDLGLETVIAEMQRVVTPIHPHDFLRKDLQRVQRDLTTLLEVKEPLGISDRDQVMKQSRGLIRMLRTFIARVKLENNITTPEALGDHETDQPTAHESAV